MLSSNTKTKTKTKTLIINNIVINLKNILENNNDFASISTSKSKSISIITIKNIVDNIKQNTQYLKYFSKYNNYYIIYNSKLISKYTNINTLSNSFNNIISLELIERQNGGSLIDAFKSIIQIGELFVMLGDAVVWFFKFIAWVIKFATWFFIDFLNPVTLANDFLQSITILLITICKLPFELLQALFAVGVNTIGGWMQGFWGWDMTAISKNDRESAYFKKLDLKKGKKCYMTNSDTVPFSIILGTLLCPPIGVFMDLGTSGWLNIIICALLTLLFYLPGLCYALLIIYS